MVASPRRAALREQAIAQYFVTKVGWKGSYKRILAVTPSSVATYNPETFVCTARWELAEIEDVEASRERDQFVLRLKKARFRRTKVRFHCAARAHLLSLLATLRQRFAVAPVIDNNEMQYECIECFGDGSTQAYSLQVSNSAIVLLDDSGRTIDALPYMYLKKAATTLAHPNGLVLETPSHERLFRCSNRNTCLDAIYTAASALGVDLHWTESHLTVQLLRLCNKQLIDQPAIVRFDVRCCASADDHANVDAQLILQPDAVVEVLAPMRLVVARTFAALRHVVRVESDRETVVLEFTEGERLIVALDARDQFIALLLLTCRERGYEHVTLAATALQTSRVYHPHMIESDSQSDTVASMKSFFLDRLLQTCAIDADTTRLQRSPERQARKRSSQRKAADATLVATRDSLSDTGESLNDHASMRVAIEELNANVPLHDLGRFGHNDVLNRAVELLAEHLTSLVVTLRRFVTAANAEIVTTLQALVRLSYSSHAALSNVQIPRVFDAIHELLTHQDFVTCYWCLQLLQCYFDPVRTECLYGQRAKILQYVATQRELLSALIDLLPVASTASPRSAGVWLVGSDGVMKHMTDDPPLDTTLLANDARLEHDMNAVVYEALFTIHYITIYLHDRHQQQVSADDVEAVANNGDVTAQALREVSTATASRRAARATLVDVSPGASAKFKRFVAERLVVKHAFLMDAVVDTRLVRACLSCVALIKFVTLELGSCELDTTSTANATASNGGGNRMEHTLPGPRGGDDALQRTVEQLNAFLAAFAAKLHAQSDRSHHIEGQHTINVPLTSCSEWTDEVASSDRTGSSDYMRLEYLEVAAAERSTGNGNDDSSSNSQQCNERDSASGGSAADDECSDYDGESVHKKSELAARSVDAGATTTMQRSGDASIRSRHGSAHSDDDQLLSRLFSSSTFDFEPAQDSSSSSSVSRRHDQQPIASSRARPLKQQSSQRHRTLADAVDSAPQCDACIGCNDVCGSVVCFLCSEKAYQLETTFADSQTQTRRRGADAGGVASQSHRSAARDVDDDYGHMERTYSSCELKRHCSLRSCWVVVHGAVYDVTDLLSVHPGGLQVLIRAAQHGEDCSAIIDEHPPSARRVLRNYRLGEFYECAAMRP